jgi:peroxiredoxin
LNEGRKLRVGALAEDFTLADSAGAPRTLSSMLSDGPLLIIFYRGYW